MEDVVHHAETVPHGSENFHAAHRERAVTHDGIHGQLRVGELGADRGRDRIPHGIEVRRQDHAFHRMDREQLGGQKRVIAVIEHGDRRVGRLPA